MKLGSHWLKFALVSLPLLSIALLPSLAQGSYQRIAQGVNCNNPQTTAAMRTCANGKYEAADQKMNQVYQALKPKLSTNQQKRLTDAQLAWIKFRDTTCAFEGGQFEGGTLAGPTTLSCLAKVTQQRVQDLEGYLRDVNNR